MEIKHGKTLSEIICTPTTKEEKEYLKNIKDENGIVKPSIIDRLYELKDEIADNIFHDKEYYDQTDDSMYPEMNDAIIQRVNMARDKNEDKWVSNPELGDISDLCLLYLFYYENGAIENLDLFSKELEVFFSDYLDSRRSK